MRVVICVATFQRPTMLGELLRGLRELTPPDADAYQVSVLIVDNDSAGSSAPVVAAARPGFPFEIVHVVEPRRGIAHARNAAVARALDAGADLVAFIDDDEVPATGWLRELLAAQAQFGADAVYGPVKTRFAEPPRDWIVAGRFFDRPIVPTGQRVPIGATGNVLLTRRILAHRVPPFDPRFALTGGEDTLFFLSLQRDGIPVVSCAEAVVYETVPASRTSLHYLVKRAYAGGSAYVAAERCLAANAAWVPRRAAIALFRVAAGVAITCTRGLAGVHHAVTGLRMSALGLGMLAGLRGRRYDRYRVTQGS